MKKLTVFAVLLFAISTFAFRAALLITGEVAGNAIYELAVEGAKKASQEFGFELQVVEGGYNMARWEPTLLSLAATGKYDVIVTFTEGMPKSVEKAAKLYPKQKFVLVDGVAPTLPNVFSLAFKDEEMTFLAGYFAGLVTKSDMPGANPDLKVGLIAGDIYPAMVNKMKPAYERAAKMVDERIEVVFSVVGSWADPAKGAELARAQFSQGVDVILLICGGSGMGAIQTAKQMGKYVIGVDANYISVAPGTILACALKKIDRAVYDVLKRAYLNSLPYGTVEIWGVKEGAISFTFDDENYKKFVPEYIQKEMIRVYQDLVEGKISALP
ncbi:BMP family ABC transporter substrate-binding protein [Pseudothermotoga thermarum]|uniref:Nucleoside-binding protein n=1 Tax=Pseudothermotoga thermarum DSM 5069 TaxID=688269 RepID=F7YUZ3_9THEM|nr:BMP family ABC transporter substrate-binding protein [Pseudothermotoga thermarum]AEH50277.1 nucleoside-binding protein [Pseudothermotoga thermarum DSM 5069]